MGRATNAVAGEQNCKTRIIAAPRSSLKFELGINQETAEATRIQLADPDEAIE
jgi:hypothetical protein